LGAPECAEARLDPESLKTYFQAYQHRLPLTRYDLEKAVQLSYFQSVHALYGYHEHLVEGVLNADAMLGYAHWDVQ